jgi:hypothetical protein
MQKKNDSMFQLYIHTFWKHKGGGAKFRTERKWSTSLDERKKLTELKVIWTMPVELLQLFHQPSGLLHWIHPNQSKTKQWY